MKIHVFKHGMIFSYIIIMVEDIVNANIEEFGNRDFCLKEHEKYADFFKKGMKSGGTLGIFFLRDANAIVNLIKYYGEFKKIVVYDLKCVNRALSDYFECLGLNNNDGMIELINVENNISMIKFDKIIMNPPYDGNLHVKILSEAIIESSTPEIVCLHPKNYYTQLNTYYNQKNYKYVSICYSSLISYDEIEKKVAQDIFNRGFNTLDLIIGVYTKKHNGKDAFPFKLYELKQKIRKQCYDVASGFDNIRVPRSKLKGAYVLFNQYNVHSIQDFLADERSNVSYGIQFKNSVEKENWLNWIKNSKIIKFFLKYQCSIGLIKKNFDLSSGKLTDSEFNLTPEEITMIERETTA